MERNSRKDSQVYIQIKIYLLEDAGCRALHTTTMAGAGTVSGERCQRDEDWVTSKECRHRRARLHNTKPSQYHICCQEPRTAHKIDYSCACSDQEANPSKSHKAKEQTIIIINKITLSLLIFPEDSDDTFSLIFHGKDP